MSLWANMTQEQGQRLADNLSAYRPFVGRVVRVVEGRKHFGKVGVVIWHGVDRFSQAGRYGDSYAQAAREVMGRYGYRVGVQAEDGEKFFVPADAVMVSVDKCIERQSP